MTHVEEQNKIKVLTKEVKDTKAQKRKVTILSIFLGCLFLLTLAAFAFYVFSYSKGFEKLELSQQIIESDTLQSYKSKIAKLEQLIVNTESQNNFKNQNSIKDQIIYAVQIGAFKERDMSLFSSNLVNFKEISNSGFNKYALGNFEKLQEAQDFRRELVTLGFNDAFIASFKNNQRLKIEETN